MTCLPSQPSGCTTARRAGALLLAVLCIGAAPAEQKKPDWVQVSEPSMVEMARVELTGAYFRGDMLVGYGSRAPVQGAVGSLRLDVFRFPWERVGFDFGMRIGPMTASRDRELDGGFEAGAAFAPLRWEGPWGGSVIVGAGGGFGTARPVWLEDDLQAYPFVITRARLFPSQYVGIHLGLQYTPITTDSLRVQAYEIDAAMSVGLFQLGARGRLDFARGGDPERTYGGYWIGPFAAIGVY